MTAIGKVAGAFSIELVEIFSFCAVLALNIFKKMLPSSSASQREKEMILGPTSMVTMALMVPL